jgi:transketolase C-terminal domain/subunit
MMHPRVMISSIDMNFGINEAKITGKGAGFVAVGQQFYVLKTRSFIKSVSLDRMSKGSKEGESYVDFSFTIVFDETLFEF